MPAFRNASRGGPSPLGLTLLPPSLQHYLNADIVTFTEVSKDPKGMEWLWNPQIVGIYNRLLQRCELNKHTTEAASGALQNITAGDRRVRPQEGNLPWALSACSHHPGNQSWAWAGDAPPHGWHQPVPGWGTWPSPYSPPGRGSPWPSPIERDEEEEEDGAGGGGGRWVPGGCLQGGVCLGSGRAC